MRRKNAARRRRACIVENEEGKVRRGRMRADVIRRRNRDSASLVDRHPGTICSRAISGRFDSFGPRSQINVIRLRQSPTLLDIQENYGSQRKSIPLRRRHRISRVEPASFARRRRRPQFTAISSTIEQQKSEPLTPHGLPLSSPCVCFFSRRRAQPVASKRERLAKYTQRFVTGKKIQIESEIGCRSFLMLLARGVFVRLIRKNNRAHGNRAIEQNGRAAFHFCIRVRGCQKMAPAASLRAACVRRDFRAHRRQRICKPRSASDN